MTGRTPWVCLLRHNGPYLMLAIGVHLKKLPAVAGQQGQARTVVLVHFGKGCHLVGERLVKAGCRDLVHDMIQRCLSIPALEKSPMDGKKVKTDNMIAGVIPDDPIAAN